MKGSIFIISGPSGVGKGTIVRMVCDKRPHTWLSVSVTTRQQRPGEVPGRDYDYITRDEFIALRDSGGLAEYAEVYSGHMYGTPSAPMREHVENGDDVILEIDTVGAENIKKSFPEAVSVFILPPTVQTLMERLRGRATETEEQRAERFKAAEKEIAKASRFDYLIVNDVVEDAAERLIEIMDEKRREKNDRPADQ